MKVRIGRVLMVLLSATLAVADEAWDAREARGVRQTIYPAIEHLPDYSSVRTTFEKGLAGDAAAASDLAALVNHSNEDVAATAAQMLGRFPSPAASAVLKGAYSVDSRLLVRSGALAGLARMKDAETATLAIAALSSKDEALHGIGLGALEALGDSAHAPAIVQYLERHPENVSSDLLESLGRLGDPAGSTAVREKLVAEASRKLNPLSLRYGAALGLRAMGQALLAQPILDIMSAKNTNSKMIVVKSAMDEYVARRPMIAQGQADVDTVFREAEISTRYRRDEWGQPLRAKYISKGLFHVFSDGPDKTADTADDLSTAETWHAYVDRVFPGQFYKP